MTWLLTLGIALFILFILASLIFFDEWKIFQYFWGFVYISFASFVLLGISYDIAATIICEKSNKDSKYCIEK